MLKPSELTPLTALALHSLAIQAGIPPHVLQVVTAGINETPDVGHEFCTNPAVAKVSFTGSTAVGKTLMEWSRLQRLSLELGGNAPFVVFEDADLDQAVAGAVASKFRNAGQTCVCADRFLIHASLHDAFVEQLTKRVQDTVVLGDGMNEATTMGPLISAKAVASVHAKVQKAISEGAKRELGGSAPKAQFYEPTILTNVSTESDVWKTETFGPVAAIRSFETEDEALELANDSRVGLAAYFFTRNMSRVFRFGQRYG